ncbi:hypothetical protein D0Y65_017635 [Glycine soja]|uniref:Uncharacterized protein n=1 Tax=Glycine soja TaxID=3848 RepID=A0A445JVQ0_GLYSO|nr:hypothetical protein D0Y65_017635 [Glycine soja]
MEKSSSSYTIEARSRVFCLCNVEAPLVTSWTEDNPGRRFYGCGQYKIVVVELLNWLPFMRLISIGENTGILLPRIERISGVNYCFLVLNNLPGYVKSQAPTHCLPITFFISKWVTHGGKCNNANGSPLFCLD